MMRLAGLLLVPVALAAALIGRLLLGNRTKNRTADEVADYLRNFLDDKGGEWDWDDFESVPIADPELDRIRLEAVRAGPPNPDMDKLAALLREAEALRR